MEHEEDIRDNPCKQHFRLAEQLHSPYPHIAKKPNIAIFKGQFVSMVDLEVHKQVNLGSR